GPGAVPVTGTVRFAVDGTEIGSAPVAWTAGAYRATLTITAPGDLGEFEVTATFDGDTNLHPSATTAPGTLTVGTTVRITVDDLNTTVVFGEAVHAHVTVTPDEGAGVPTGTVTLTVDGTAVTAQATLVDGEADLTITDPIPVDTHTVSVAYSGDTTYAIRQQAVGEVTVGKAN